MTRRNVTGAARDELLARYAAGERASALGREYGLSPSSIRQAANAAGIVVRGNFGQRLTAEQVAEIIRLRRAGLSMDAIAARIGRGRTSVANTLRKAGFAPAPPGRGSRLGRFSPETRKEAVERYAAGGSSAEVAAEFGTTAPTVVKWARAAGVPIRPQGGWPGMGSARSGRALIGGSARSRAWSLASSRLVRLHRDEFKALYAEELARLAPEEAPDGH